ncbi:hypothetical protein [Schinkia azotoformans]|uniref:hypothetical protein n=1 Tax=Schinkia azotoformans TaxID=1454 RepID=UPI002DBA5661|nr:hypothetical protein [Schinkia azotoformans]MEC1757356.1 hypothetical protein [Schinkia azotoformans]
MKKIKFEYLFSFSIMIVLSGALYMFRGNQDIVNIIITALVGGFSAITTFFFTKHNPTNNGDDK